MGRRGRRRSRRVARRSLLPLAAALLLPAAALRAQPAHTGSGGDGGADGTAVPVERPRGYPAVALSRLPTGVLRDIEVRGTRILLVGDRGQLELREGSPFFRWNGDLRQHPNPAFREGGEDWIPAALLPMVVSGVFLSPAGDRLVHRRGRPAERSGPWRVVIDPGHGGRDPGAIGPRGTREKEVVLAVAKRLAERLDGVDGIDVLLTREGDEFLSLRERSLVAVRNEADLFLSIHANLDPRGDARGFETYFLGEARTEEAREVAIRENSAIRFEESSGSTDLDAVQQILARTYLRDNQRESAYVAGHIQNSLRQELPTPDRGVKQAGYLVLVDASGSMPAILAEIGFLSDPWEERFLRSGRGQERIARAMADAVRQYYRQDYGPRVVRGGR